MNKKLRTIAACAILFASCGGGNDMEKDAKELCDCIAKGDATPCYARFQEMKKNYSKEESKQLWEKGNSGCK